MHAILHLVNEMSPYLLLGFLLAGLMHAFVPGRYYTRYLSAPTLGSVVRAALFGIPLPLCSCGVIPTAMSLRREGASHGAVVSFLIATPQTGVDSIIATFSLMGLPFAALRPFAALVTAVLGGAVTNAFSARQHPSAAASPSVPRVSAEGSPTFTRRLGIALDYAFRDMMADIGKWLVIGLVVAGLITVLVPDSLFHIFQGNTWASMLLVLCIAVPMYLCATGSIPIAVALMLKGLTPGAALVLLMAGPACNMASILVIDKVLGRRTLLAYILSIVAGAVAFGCLVDWLQFSGHIDFLASLTATASCCAGGDSLLSWLCTALLAALLLNALVLPKLGLGTGHECHCHDRDGHASHTADGAHTADGDACAGNACDSATRVYRIKGMSCSHCATACRQAIAAQHGVTAVSVSLAEGTATVAGTARESDIRQAVETLGFKMEGGEE